MNSGLVATFRPWMREDVGRTSSFRGLAQTAFSSSPVANNRKSGPCLADEFCCPSHLLKARKRSRPGFRIQAVGAIQGS